MSAYADVDLTTAEKFARLLATEEFEVGPRRGDEEDDDQGAEIELESR